MQISVAGLDTHYEVQGQGRTVLLVHGWGDSSAGLKRLCQALAQTYRVVALDLPGFGTTPATPAPWRFDEYGRYIAAFLQAVGQPKPYAVIGHSSGAAVLMRGIAQRAFTARKVVLLGSSGIPNTYRPGHRLLRAAAKAAKHLALLLPASIQAKLKAPVYAAIGSDKLVPESLQMTFKHVVTDDVRPDAAQLTMPVLLIYGAEDRSAPPWYGRQFQDLMPDAQLCIIPGAGHFVHIDREGDVLKEIKEFLQ